MRIALVVFYGRPNIVLNNGKKRNVSMLGITANETVS